MTCPRQGRRLSGLILTCRCSLGPGRRPGQRAHPARLRRAASSARASAARESKPGGGLGPGDEPGRPRSRKRPSIASPAACASSQQRRGRGRSRSHSPLGVDELQDVVVAAQRVAAVPRCRCGPGGALHRCRRRSRRSSVAPSRAARSEQMPWSGVTARIAGLRRVPSGSTTIARRSTGSTRP